LKASGDRIETKRRYPCPCCGYLTADGPHDYNICDICGWENDVSMLRFASMGGGANDPSLQQAQRNFEQFGASDPKASADGRITVRKPSLGDTRDPGWRPIRDDEVDVPEPGVDRGHNYPTDYTQLYYWRETFWRRKQR
jgi:hypothetical protein